MALNFPASPTVGQTFSYASVVYTWNGTVWNAGSRKTALPFNYLVNAGMQHSQENGDTVVLTNGAYPADQWMLGTTIANSCAARFPNAFRYSNGVATWGGTAKPVLAAGDFQAIIQFIEGERIRDWAFGYPGARPLVLRFRAYSTLGGIYSAVLNNVGSTRSWIGQFTLAAAAWTEVILVIPGDTTGTWPNDRTKGAQLAFVAAVGTTYHGVAGWQAGNKLGLASNTNNAANTNANLYIAEPGLYLDPYSTGLPPPYEMTDFAAELLACSRYYTEVQGLRGATSTSTTANRVGQQNPVEMRVTPVYTMVGPPTIYDGNSAVPVTGASVVSNTHLTEFNTTTGAGLLAVRGGMQLVMTDGSRYWATSARM